MSLRSAISASDTFTPAGYRASSMAHCTCRPVRVVVAPISCTIVWWLTSGLPRQFCVINEKRRCSNRFHLLVPGGRWRLVEMARPSFVRQRLPFAFPSAYRRRYCRRSRR